MDLRQKFCYTMLVRLEDDPQAWYGVFAVWRVNFRGGKTMQNEKIKLAIIADDKNLTRVVWECLQVLNVFELAGVARANLTELNALFKNEIDVFLLDIALSGMEDTCFFQAVSSHYGGLGRPACIAFFPVEPNDLDYDAFQSDVDYFIQKPFDVNTLSRSIINVYNARNEDKPPLDFERPNPAQIDEDEFIGGLLNAAGVRSTLKGHTYLKSAISFGIRDRALTESITKVLYPVVAKAHKTTPVNVERAIRHALEDSGQADFAHVFQVSGGKNEKITNGKFIKLAVEQYYMGIFPE